MARPWIVLPHKPLEKLSDTLWCAVGRMPRGSIRRRMMIARLADGRLAFLNAVPLDEPSMREIESWGTPSFVIVPNGFHRLDLQPFRARYPQLEFLAGPGSQKRVSKMVPVAGGWDRFPKDPNVEIVPVAGNKMDEPWVLVRGGGGVDLCMPGDTMMNIAHFGGVQGFIFRQLGSTGGPRVTSIAKLFLVRDKAALRRQLEQLAATPGLRRFVPCHGAIAPDAAAALRDAASHL